MTAVLPAALFALAGIVGNCHGPASPLPSAGEVTCQEDQAAVVAPDNGTGPDLDWVCVTLDDFADRDSIDRLDTILAG